jgi:hypothetical protein
MRTPFMNSVNITLQKHAIINITDNTAACLLRNATNNLWILLLTLHVLDIRQAELQLIITPLILLCNSEQ